MGSETAHALLVSESVRVRCGAAEMFLCTLARLRYSHAVVSPPATLVFSTLLTGWPLSFSARGILKGFAKLPLGFNDANQCSLDSSCQAYIRLTVDAMDPHLVRSSLLSSDNHSQNLPVSHGLQARCRFRCSRRRGQWCYAQGKL